MTPRPTPERLAELRRISEAQTPERGDDADCLACRSGMGMRFYADLDPTKCCNLCAQAITEDDVPSLLAEIDALTAELAAALKGQCLLALAHDARLSELAAAKAELAQANRELAESHRMHTGREP